MKAWIISSAIVIGGCSSTPPVIVDLQHDKVVVQEQMLTDIDQIAAKAAEGCALHNRKGVPVSVSCAGGSSCSTSCAPTWGYGETSCVTTCSEGCWTRHHLFACTASDN